MIVVVSNGCFQVKVVGQSADIVVKCNQFKTWLANFDFAHMDLASIAIQSADIFNGGKVIFVKMETEVYDRATGTPLPGIVYLRGRSICIQLFLRVIETQQVYIVTIRQPRVPVGKYDYIEIPAGTMDKEDGPVGRMIGEVKEETGIEISAKDLYHLGEWVPSTGGCDEVIDSFYASKDISQAHMNDTLQRIHGADGENELIRVFVNSIDDYVGQLAKGVITDAKALATLMLLLLKKDANFVVEQLNKIVLNMSQK